MLFFLASSIISLEGVCPPVTINKETFNSINSACISALSPAIAMSPSLMNSFKDSACIAATTTFPGNTFLSSFMF